MILGVGMTQPREFFLLSRMKGIEFQGTGFAYDIGSLRESIKSSNHVIYFDVPETLCRVSPIFLFDFRVHDYAEEIFIEKNPMWSAVRFCASGPPFCGGPAALTPRRDTVQKLLDANRENDVMDKLNLIMSLLQKPSRKKKAEKLIIEYLLGKSDLAYTVASLRSIKRGDKSFFSAVDEFEKWADRPVRYHLMNALSVLLKDRKNWRDNVWKIAEEFHIRHFELGYVMSFLERQKQ